MAEKKKKEKSPSFQRGTCITVENCQKLVMEGVEKIAFCDSEQMILKSSFSLTVEGSALKLLELGNSNVAVLGKIRAIYFGEKAE